MDRRTETEIEKIKKERMTNFFMVKEFHTAFGFPDPDKLIIPTPQLQQLRLNFILDEIGETAAEFGYGIADPTLVEYVNKKLLPPPNMAKVAKELADILYFTYGAAANFGIDMDAVFAEVHRSNMTKLGLDGKPILREDGKILKGPNYEEADIEKVLYGDR